MTCNRLKEFTAREGTVSLAYEEHPELKSHVEECDDCRIFESDEKALDHLISMGQPALPQDLPALIQRKPIWYQPFWGIAAMIFIAAFMIYQNMPSPEQGKGFMENESPKMTIFTDKDLEKENLREEMAPQPVTAPVEHEVADTDKSRGRDEKRTDGGATSAVPSDAAGDQKEEAHRSKPKKEKKVTTKGRVSRESLGDMASVELGTTDLEKGFVASPVSAPVSQPVGHIQEENSSPAMADTIYEKEEDTLSDRVENKRDYSLEETISETNLFKNVIQTDSMAPTPTAKSKARSKKTAQSTLTETRIVIRIEVHEVSTRTGQKIVNYDLAANPIHTALVTILAIPTSTDTPFAVNQMISLGTKYTLTPGKAVLTLRPTGNQNRPFDMVKVER